MRGPHAPRPTPDAPPTTLRGSPLPRARTAPRMHAADLITHTRVLAEGNDDHAPRHACMCSPRNRPPCMQRPRPRPCRCMCTSSCHDDGGGEKMAASSGLSSPPAPFTQRDGALRSQLPGLLSPTASCPSSLPPTRAPFTEGRSATRSTRREWSCERGSCERGASFAALRAPLDENGRVNAGRVNGALRSQRYALHSTRMVV